MAATFDLISPFQPAGDQPQAIEKLAAGFRNGQRRQTLLGATGTGKTFTAAHVIAQLGKPTLVLSHNKTLAAQLYKEFRAFFPRNAVHYFISYYDYYQPEAYIPQRDIYIEKDAQINQNLDRLRLAATSALVSRALEGVGFAFGSTIALPRQVPDLHVDLGVAPNESSALVQARVSGPGFGARVLVAGRELPLAIERRSAPRPSVGAG